MPVIDPPTTPLDGEPWTEDIDDRTANVSIVNAAAEAEAGGSGTSGTVILTQTEYDALPDPDPTTTYLIKSGA